MKWPAFAGKLQENPLDLNDASEAGLDQDDESQSLLIDNQQESSNESNDNSTESSTDDESPANILSADVPIDSE